MLALYQIIETECVFLAIDQKHLPYDLCYEVVGVFYKKIQNSMRICYG